MKCSPKYPDPGLFEGGKLTLPEDSLSKVLQWEKMYRLFAEKTGRMFFNADIMSGKIEWVGAIEDVTGYDAEEFHETDLISFKEFLHPEDRKRITEAIDFSLETG